MLRVTLMLATLAIAPTFATAAEPNDGWVSLFDGKTTDGWLTYRGKPIERGWVVEDGTLYRSGMGGDIITAEQFDNFELEFDWKVAEGSNSGVMYRVRQGDIASYFSGPEYQVLDDEKHKDGGNPKTSAGSLYALVAAEGKELKPVGEWNSARIVLRGNHLEHWLNGKKVVEIEIHSDDWNKLVAESKFAKWKRFGNEPTGHICLQDHGDPVWYRNIRIRRLSAE